MQRQVDAGPAPRGEEASNLTRSQFLIWTGQQLHPDTPLYNMVMTFTIRGALRVEAFETAFENLVEQTDALRTVFVERDGVPFRRVVPAPGRLERVDLSGHADPDAALRGWIEQRAIRQFDLDRCLFDAALIRLRESEHVWYLNQHHLITDGWAIAVVYERMEALYRQACGRGPDPDSPYPSFEAYADHERRYRSSEAYRKALDFWQRKTVEPAEPVRFYGVQPAAGGTTRTERVTVDLGPDRSRAVLALAAAPDVAGLTGGMSYFNVFATVLFACLARIGGRRSFTVLAPAHNRTSRAFARTAGLFIEILPLHVTIDEDETADTLLTKVAAESHALVIRARPGTSSATQNRDYPVLLNVINASFSGFDGMPMQSEWIHPGHGDSSQALRLQIHDFDQRGSIRLHFDVRRDVFDELRREALVRHFLTILDAVLEDRTRPLSGIDLVSPDEHRQHVVAFNETARPLPGGTVVQRFEAQVARDPDATAVICGDRRLRYGELNARSNRLARRLVGQGVQTGTPVGICLRRSPEMLVAIWGVLKAGGCYVPLDPDYPAERLAFLVADSGVPIVLSEPALTARIPAGPTVLHVADAPAGGDGTAAVNPAAAAGPDDLAYVIYTSGSTGSPKGAMVPHRGLLNYALWAIDTYGADGPLDFPLYSSFAFDLTVTSIFVPLLSGGTIVVYPDGEGEDGRLAVLRVFEEDRVDIVKLTPAHLALLEQQGVRCARIRKLIVGGEDLKTVLARGLARLRDGPLDVFNEYGPTEATVGCMTHRYDPALDIHASVPLGRPAANTRIHVLDAAMRPVATGIIGELYIGGEGLARGYLNQPALTAERFVDDPFRPGARLYRTGDLARWQSPGTLLFAGRNDDQLKIRGARVELAETEAAILAHPDVIACTLSVIDGAATPAAPPPVRHCIQCGLASSHPDARLGDDDVCSLCRSRERYEQLAHRYFRTMRDLQTLVQQAASPGQPECLMLLSGGKDSTYALYQLVELGFRPLVFTLDNGYISEGAKANMRRAVDALGLELVFGSTPAMPDIFVDSLERFGNVCQGCFKTIYTLAINLARERGIRVIVTGLSRGQIFATRLAELLRNDIDDPDQIDRAIVDARIAYHRADDAVRRHLDVRAFQDDALFDELQIVDFYRYCDVSLDEMLGFLSERAPWVRPADTGRSTNCLINDAGILVHRRERGFHNYALPYSWDVRLGHKTRAESLRELDDDIDTTRVHQILREIGYDARRLSRPATDDGNGGRRLCAYYVPRDPSVTAAGLRSWVARKLPDYMIPSYFVPVDGIPLTAHGKVDRRALPDPRAPGRGDTAAKVPPRDDVERTLAAIWRSALGVDDLGVHDDFIALGGDSIINIQIVSRARKAGLYITPQQLFDHPTVAGLAAVAVGTRPSPDPGPATGEVPLTPIQQWFFERDLVSPAQWSQAVRLIVPADADTPRLEAAFRAVQRRHDMLRTRFECVDHVWHQHTEADGPPIRVQDVPAAGLSAGEIDALIDATVESLNARMDLGRGELVQAAVVRPDRPDPDRLIVVIHHLIIDGVSWSFLLEDLEAAYAGPADASEVALPPTTTPYQQWSHRLAAWAASDAARAQVDTWAPGHDAGTAARHRPDAARERPDGEVQTVTVTVERSRTEALLREVPAVYNTRTDDVLVTALLSALRWWTGASTHRLLLEGHGRQSPVPDVDLTRTVGWFTALYPLTLSLPGEDPVDALRAVKEQLRSVPDHGIGYGALRYLSRDARIANRLAAQPEPAVLFNDLGRFESATAATRLFRLDGPLRLAVGPNPQLHRLSVNATISDGQLHVNFTAVPGPIPLVPDAVLTLDREALDGLAAAFRRALHGVMDGVLADTSGGFTPSDFPEAGLSQAELDALVRAFGEPPDAGES